MQAEILTCEKCTQLEAGLESRTTIGIALGLLMERERITQEAAFSLLTKQSQRSNRKVRDIAADLVATAGATGQSRRARKRAQPEAPRLQSVV